MGTRKLETPMAVIPLAETRPLAELELAFETLVTAVELMLDPESQGEIEKKLVASVAGAALSAPESIDGIVALINAREFQELLLRKAVQQAEARARHHGAFVKGLKSSIQLYMEEKGIARIEGLAHRFAIYKQPDQLEISNEDLIPEEYWEVQMVPERILNKEQLIADIRAGKEIPGANLTTSRKRLDVK
jgi:hypothetical protein